MGYMEKILDPKYQLVKCVCGWTLIFLYYPPYVWLYLSMVDQSSISFSIEDFYIAALGSTNVSNFNQSIIYFKLHLENNEDGMGVYYENLNLTFSYYANAGIVSTGNYTIPGFHQGIKKKTDRNAYVVTTQGNSWQEISENVSSPSGVVFRVDLGTAVKFRELFSKAKSKTRKIMAWADVEVDRISGKKSSKKAIQLKHMIVSSSGNGTMNAQSFKEENQNFSEFSFSTQTRPANTNSVVINDRFGIAEGLMTTIHSITELELLRYLQTVQTCLMGQSCRDCKRKEAVLGVLGGATITACIL